MKPTEPTELELYISCTILYDVVLLSGESHICIVQGISNYCLCQTSLYCVKLTWHLCDSFQTALIHLHLGDWRKEERKKRKKSQSTLYRN